MSKFTDAIDSNLGEFELIAVGMTEDCDECPDGEDEGFFSWSACDSCGSTLGGTRYAAHAVKKTGVLDTEIMHIDICVDCLMYHANGDEPEAWAAA
jgi:hypothetical protein